jgi:hypothetical protein
MGASVPAVCCKAWVGAAGAAFGVAPSASKVVARLLGLDDLNHLLQRRGPGFPRAIRSPSRVRSGLVFPTLVRCGTGAILPEKGSQGFI